VGDGRATVLFNPCKSKIDASRNARRSVDVTVLDPKQVRFDADQRVALRQFLTELPVRRCALAVEQSRFRQEECPTQTEPMRRTTRATFLKPREESGVPRIARGDAAHQQERIEGTLEFPWWSWQLQRGSSG